MAKFSELGLHEDLIEAISWMGFENATPIQEKAIPTILKGTDLIACAQTGTGKTAAFLLPILNLLKDDSAENTRCMVICPTRELAIQIDQQIQALGYFAGISSIPLYGGGSGQAWEQEKKAIKQGVNIIVATPGKLISHLNLGYMKLQGLTHLILDEADRMLDIGFFDDIVKIINHLPKERQTLMFSATMDPKIRKLAKHILKDPQEISIAISKPAAGILQAAYMCHDYQKTDLVHQLISDKPSYKTIIIFCSTKRKVADLTRSLQKKKVNAEAISSDLDQKEREKVLSQFRAKQVRVLVGTDVVSRGIDIADINLVINYDVPTDAEDYVHRIGRTARADTTGVAITLINDEEIYKFNKIEKLTEKDVMKVPLPPGFEKGPEYTKSGKKRPSFRPKGRNSRNNNRSYNNNRSHNKRR